MPAELRAGFGHQHASLGRSQQQCLANLLILDIRIMDPLALWISVFGTSQPSFSVTASLVFCDSPLQQFQSESCHTSCFFFVVLSGISKEIRIFG